jgi:hypothetical protein
MSVITDGGKFGVLLLTEVVIEVFGESKESRAVPPIHHVKSEVLRQKVIGYQGRPVDNHKMMSKDLRTSWESFRGSLDIPNLINNSNNNNTTTKVRTLQTHINYTYLVHPLLRYRKSQMRPRYFSES